MTEPSGIYRRGVQTSSSKRPPADLPLPELAICRRPADQYAALRARGVHRLDDGWVVARPEDVAAALASPALSVAPPGSPLGAARQLQARMARFSDGADHARRRAVLEALLPGVEGVEQAAAVRAGALLGGWVAPFDVMPLARTVPVAVLAAALGVASAHIERVVTLTSRLCDALAPSLAPPPASRDVDLVASELVALLEPMGPWDIEQVAAAAGVLFQARDATAALIGAALLAGDHEPHGDADRWIERALWQDAPVQCTRRVAIADVVLGGVAVPRGASVWVVLAGTVHGGTERGPAAFGAGPHACPGSSLALALARGVVAAVRACGLRPVPGQPVSYEPRPNLRLPARVLVERS